MALGAGYQLAYRRLMRRIALALVLVGLLLMTGTAAAARLPTPQETQALVLAAHRKRIIEREEGPDIPGGSRLVNRALPWAEEGCCTIHSLRISTIGPRWAEGVSSLWLLQETPNGSTAYTEVPDNEALLFEKIRGTWTLIEVGRGDLSGRIVPSRILKELGGKRWERLEREDEEQERRQRQRETEG